MNFHEIEEGFVIRIKGANYYIVSEGSEVKCFLRGKFRISGDRDKILPVVGDSVKFRKQSNSKSVDYAGLIVSVEERKSVFARSISFGTRRKKILGA
jgi:putative ribosome biogenesis GTPase RsgA